MIAKLNNYIENIINLIVSQSPNYKQHEGSIQMTTKQRAYLKGLAMTLDPIYQIGKSSLTPEITEGVSEALEARELIKINILKNCLDDPKEIAQVLSERTHSQVVQVIGKKIVLYRESKDKKKIILPEDKKKGFSSK
jgi:RNA-binding protein